LLPITVTHELLENGQGEFEVDMRTLLDDLQTNITWDDRIEVRPNLVLYIKPFDYKTVNASNISEFETQRIINVVGDANMSEEDKLLAFKESFQKLTSITVDLINKAVYKIDSDAGSTDDPEFIKEFMENTDVDVFDAVKERLDDLRERNKVKPFKINVSPDQDNPIWTEVPIVFDYASFFA
jgi:hypothetical protein